jgi:site-specific recombinase XerD
MKVLGAVKSGVKSASIPTAQNINQCALPGHEAITSSELKACYDSIPSQCSGLNAVIELLYLNGCRISEILNIAPNQITGQGQVLIKGKKNSADRIIVAVKCRDYLLRCRAGKVYPFQNFSRFFVYREFKKMGIDYKFEGKCRNSVTHAFRHNLVRDLQSEGIEREVYSHHIGHKSLNSTKSYEYKER